jgi:DNA repair protein RadD
MVLPTGSGKSLVIANIARELEEPTLVFQPTKEILEQNFAKLLAYGCEAGIYSASLNSKKIRELTFATIGSVKSHPDAFRQFKNIIVDECHLVNPKKGMYKDFLGAIGGKVLGLTATPYRLTTDGYGGSILKFLTRTRPRVFKEVIHVTQNGELFDQGYLAQLRYLSMNGFDSSQIQLNSTGADYDDGSVRRYYEKVGFIDNLNGVVDRCLESGRRNVLVFTRFIEESQALVDSLNGQAEIVTGKTPKREREGIIDRFRSGQTRVVSNVGVLTVGFDFPELETILMARPTMSLALYYQIIGRGIRIHPGKEYSLIVDLCDNFPKFGKVEDLELERETQVKWIVTSSGRQLTNIYYGDRYVPKKTG